MEYKKTRKFKTCVIVTLLLIVVGYVATAFGEVMVVNMTSTTKDIDYNKPTQNDIKKIIGHVKYHGLDKDEKLHFWYSKTKKLLIISEKDQVVMYVYYDNGGYVFWMKQGLTDAQGFYYLKMGLFEEGYLPKNPNLFTKDYNKKDPLILQ